jgi:hypothetical protein
MGKGGKTWEKRTVNIGTRMATPDSDSGPSVLSGDEEIPNSEMCRNGAV